MALPDRLSLARDFWTNSCRKRFHDLNVRAARAESADRRVKWRAHAYLVEVFADRSFASPKKGSEVCKIARNGRKRVTIREGLLSSFPSFPRRLMRRGSDWTNAWLHNYRRFGVRYDS